MWNYLSKFISAFCYGSGFMLAVICAFYAVNQYSNSSIQLSSNESSKNKTENNFSSDIELKNISKLSNFTNYSNEGRKEEYIFTGEVVNNSQKNSYDKLSIEVDLYDVKGRFIFKCDGWDGSGMSINPQQTETFKKQCHRMPAEISERYSSHKLKVKQRRF